MTRSAGPQLEDCKENFRGDDGEAYVVRCPSCKKENWAMAVATGQCCWCGWKESPRADEGDGK